ncbi:MAG TPA: SCP2 sterol-binding domain-containing protein [Baekduia sp.]|nr:SCP2 sterol-binding domain-containing protein [Baekduia sp.]
MTVGRQLARRGGPWLAAKVAAAEDEQLARLLRTPPAGRLLLWAIFTGMPHRVRASSTRAHVEWRITRHRERVLTRRLVLDPDGPQVRPPRPGDAPADLVLHLDEVSFVRLASGDRSVTWLILRGHLRVEGSKLLAARLLLDLDPPVPSRADGR